MALGKDEIAELRADIAAARKRDMNFAFCVGKTPETSILMCDKLKKANVLHRKAKKDGETNKIASGIMNVKGKVVALTCLSDPPPAIARKVKLYLKAGDLSMKVLILNADGQELESDGDEDEAVNPVETSVQNDPVEDAGNDTAEQLAALKAEFAGTTQRVRNIQNAEAQAKLAAALKNVAADVSAGNLEKASTGLKAINAAIERVTDGGQSAPAPDMTVETGNESTQWTDVAAKLEPRVLAALKSNHPEATKIRAVWGFAQEKAQAGELNAALQAAERLDAILGAAPAATDAAPQNVVAFQRSRILWIDAKRAMRDGLDSFRNAVTQQSSDDEDQSDITDAVDTLVAEFDAFDTQLEDILDEITQAPEGPERTKLKTQAARVIGTYMGVLENPFFQIIDNNPFVSVNVAARGKSSLSLVQSTLA